MKVELQELAGRGLYREALSLYARCHGSSLWPSAFTFPLLLKTCGKLGLTSQTQQIHAHVVKAGFLFDVYTATALTDAYMKLRDPGEALKLFDEVPNKSVASYNAVIGGLRRSGRLAESVGFLRRLQGEGFLPSAATVAGLLPSFGSLQQGCQLHGLSVKLGYELDDYVSTSLVAMYSVCGQLSAARRVFNLLPFKKVVERFPCEAVDFFMELMDLPGEKPNASTLVSLLSACSDLSDFQLGRQIHSYLMKTNQEEDDGMVGAALVYMYGKCGSPQCAYQMFESLPHKELTAWNSMIYGLLLHKRLDDALELFRRLDGQGLTPDSTTWNLMISGFSQEGDAARAFEFFRTMISSGCVLQACSEVSNLRSGKEIHGYALRTRSFYDDFVLTALVSMYMKCGDSLHARRVFDQIERRSADAALWNAMISGYGRNGETEAALEIFTLMQKENVKPNCASFLCAISVVRMFRTMSVVHGLSPTAEHFSCMVDLLGRGGSLDEALGLLKEMPSPATSAYYSLLGAAICYGDAKLGELAAKKLSELDPGNPSALVMLSNIYAKEGRWSDVERLRKTVAQKTLKKSLGFSRIQMVE
ncbi:unnamed protein product [Spirodela intermedia]|uniref:Uncharacterized protein n=1 Tax=Spirodela intermedia TaxID=51605 RepID=A0A7I8ISC8_SPIIN|nr:unnamed protein product [Spirodela intermedia]CAA6660899.1 unnamed protein product [Spirodela intermedia]